MRTLLTSLIIIYILFTTMSHSSDNQKKSPQEAMRELRIKFLTAPPSEFGISPSKRFAKVYGIIMDWPVDDLILSVVSLSDGNASLYTNSSFGVIGGFAHEKVKTQAIKFVEIAANYYELCSSTNDFPYPSVNTINFYLITFEGVRILSADRESVEGGNHRFSDLFYQGQAVLTELRKIEENSNE
jgi:hypothetical protein